MPYLSWARLTPTSPDFRPVVLTPGSYLGQAGRLRLGNTGKVGTVAASNTGSLLKPSAGIHAANAAVLGLRTSVTF
jgi:hypothetical protein